MACLRFEKVGVRRESRWVLKEIDLVLDERRIGIIGLNGSGKSTLLKLVNGLLLPDEGRVLVDGLETRSDARAVRRRVGFIFQNPDNQIVFPIVSEDMAFGLRNIGIAAPQIPGRIAAVLERLGIAHLAERQSHTLSGGEKQLVALASVLVMRPDLVLFDEPTSGLDLRNRNAVRDMLARLEEQAIVASHDLDLLDGFDRVLVLEAGRVAFDGAPAAALAFYAERYG